jgi:hypothetical protein
MKTIFVLLTTTALVTGVTSAMATEFQASDEASGYELTHRSGWGSGGAYNSVVVPGDARNSTRAVPPAIQPYEVIDFQAGGSH